jgi:integrase
MAAARKSSRYSHRDATMILIGYRHGLRASELCDLQWSQVELATGRLHVRRAKNGSPSVHPMQGDEIRALRRLQREQGPSSHVFMTERDGPMTPKAFHALFGRIGGSGQAAIPGTSTHAATWLWLCPGERGPRHTGATGLARAQEHPAHSALHRAGAGSVQGFLAIGAPRDPNRFRTIQVYPKDGRFRGILSLR